MNKKRESLGKGLDALMSDFVSDEDFKEAITSDAQGSGHFNKELPLEYLERGQYQPRRNLDPSALTELSNSILRQGVMQPIIVREIATNRYEIIAGERRWRASQQAGLEKARQVLERISVLASQAADPFLSNTQRASMNDEMDGLKSELENLRTTDFNGKYLFDDLASLTAKNFSFNDDLKEEVGVTEYSASEDVMYKSGRVILDVNTGTWMERFEVMQGSNTLFDSGYWATNGNAYSDDFDRFIIEFSPGKDHLAGRVLHGTNSSRS